MKCPRGLKKCQTTAYRKYTCGSWFCSGISSRKAVGGVKMVCIRLCINGFFHKSKCILQCTPDEASQLGGMLSVASAEWMNNREDYLEWVEDNDK